MGVRRRWSGRHGLGRRQHRALVRAPAGAPPDWSPLPGAVVGAVFWPVALFVAIEILARTAWPAGLPWKVVRLGGLLPVAVVAAVVSYRHLAGLIRFYGEDGLTATVGPLAVDGLMIVASAAIVASAPAPAPPGGGAEATPASARSDATPSPPVASTSAPRGDVVKPLGRRRQPWPARGCPGLRPGRAAGRTNAVRGSGGKAVRPQQPVGTTARPRRPRLSRVALRSTRPPPGQPPGSRSHPSRTGPLSSRSTLRSSDTHQGIAM